MVKMPEGICNETHLYAGKICSDCSNQIFPLLWHRPYLFTAIQTVKYLILFHLNPPVKTVRRQIRFLTGREIHPSLHWQSLQKIPIYSALALYTLITTADVPPSLFSSIIFKLHWKQEDTKEDREMLHDTHFTFTTCFALSLSLPFSLCVSDGIHVPDLFRRVGNSRD